MSEMAELTAFNPKTAEGGKRFQRTAVRLFDWMEIVKMAAAFSLYGRKKDLRNGLPCGAKEKLILWDRRLRTCRHEQSSDFGFFPKSELF